MTSSNRDAHAIETTLVGVEEYQTPPREEAPGKESNAPGPEEPIVGQPVDINLLEAQQQNPSLLETTVTIVIAPRDVTDFTVSGPDEKTQPGGPRAVPPGESM